MFVSGSIERWHNDGRYLEHDFAEDLLFLYCAVWYGGFADGIPESIDRATGGVGVS